MPRKTLRNSAHARTFLHAATRCCIAVALVASMIFVFAPQVANAAPTSSSSCASGVGYGGVGSTTLSVTQGGNGCVFIKYTVSGTDYFETFNYTGVDQSWTVPSGVSSATFYLIGAGGGGVPLGSTYGGGGGGGYATGSYAVTTGQIFTIIVGQAGGGVLASLVSTNCYRTPATYGGGGRSGSCSGSGQAYADRGASGGGRSAIRLSGVTTDLATAAGWCSCGVRRTPVTPNARRSVETERSNPSPVWV